MEIMGLAIIFILIGLGILFYLQFASQERPIFFQKTFKETQAVNNLLNIIPATHSSDDPTKTSCLGRSFADILQDCVLNNADMCFRAGTTENSCDFARKEIEAMLNKQLKDKGQNYYFSASAESTTYFELGEKCRGSVKPGSVPLNIKRGGILRLTLDLCI